MLQAFRPFATSTPTRQLEANGAPPMGPSRPPGRMTNQLQFIQKNIFNVLWKHECAGPFRQPLNPNEVNYDLNIYIKTPMDLGIIKRRFESNYYYSAKECMDDFDCMFMTVYAYIKPEEPEIYKAEALERIYLKTIRQMDKEEFELPPKRGRGRPKKRTSDTGVVGAVGGGGATATETSGTARNATVKKPRGTRVVRAVGGGVAVDVMRQMDKKEFEMPPKRGRGRPKKRASDTGMVGAVGGGGATAPATSGTARNATVKKPRGTPVVGAVGGGGATATVTSGVGVAVDVIRQMDKEEFELPPKRGRGRPKKRASDTGVVGPRHASGSATNKNKRIKKE